MSEQCSTCIKINKDEALSDALAAAKKKAVEEQKPIAVVWEDDHYALYDAFYAYGNNMIVIQTVSYL
jgi:hypothetical protein